MKPACIPPEINNTCIDPTPDGVTCFSYTHCLNVRSGVSGYTQPEPTQKLPAKLPQVGISFFVLLPIICTIMVLYARRLYRRR